MAGGLFYFRASIMRFACRAGEASLNENQTDCKRTPRAQSSPRTLAKGAWHGAKTARANGAGLPKARKQGKLASYPECWF